MIALRCDAIDSLRKLKTRGSIDQPYALPTSRKSTHTPLGPRVRDTTNPANSSRYKVTCREPDPPVHTSYHGPLRAVHIDLTGQRRSPDRSSTFMRINPTGKDQESAPLAWAALSCFTIQNRKHHIRMRCRTGERPRTGTI